jgi:putative DNA methylase
MCSSLWFDPADKNCPDTFRLELSNEMRIWGREHRNLMSAESFAQFEEANRNPEIYEDSLALRSLLLSFIADFADWDNSTNEAYLRTSRTLTNAAHIANGGEVGTRPVVVDPFAGGGAIPLEALRIGADAIATDLNPISVAINRIVAEFTPTYGEELYKEVERWGTIIQREAARELSVYYPTDVDGSVPIAYLWARTVISEAPNAEDVPVEIPMLKTLWLAKKGKLVAMRWKRSTSGEILTEKAQLKYADGNTIDVRRPILEVFYPTSAAEVEEGTSRRGSATCPVTGYTMSAERVRRQIRSRKGGTDDARMYCVVIDSPSEGRIFRKADARDMMAFHSASKKIGMFPGDSLGKKSLILPEPTPQGGGSGAGRAFSQRNFGMDSFGDLFLTRQLLALQTYVELTIKFIEELKKRDRGLAEAVSVCCGIIIGRLADQNAALTTWQLNTKNAAHVFVRWAIQMVWDFAEVNPLAAAGGSPESAVRRMSSAIKTLVASDLKKGAVYQGSADNHPLPDDFASALVTDPPYYDAIPYSDLLDFFYIWLKRVTDVSSTEVKTASLCPKDEECIVDEVKGKTPEYFEKMMQSCLTEQRRIVRPDGIGVVVFAHKSTAGWERLLSAVIEAGWIITASWPIDTELGLRLRAQNSAALASSIHLVCRPREATDGSLRMSDVGDWRDVLRELPFRIHEWMPRLASEGIVGADAIFACLGPALEIFSQYSSVEKPNGDLVKLREYLEYVWAAVSKEALNMIFSGADATGFEEDARLSAMWLWTLFAGASAVEGADGDEPEVSGEDGSSGKPAKSPGYILEYDAARKIAQGLGANLQDLTSIVEVKGDKARLLPVSERARDLFGYVDSSAIEKKRKTKAQKKLFEEMEEFDYESASGIGGAPEAGATTLDRIHQAMLLFSAGRSEAVRRFLVDDGVGNDERFWRLANALSALYPSGTDEKRWVDGVLARKKGLGF